MHTTHIFQHPNSFQATVGVFDYDTGRTKKLIVEFLTKCKFSVFGFLEGYLNGHTRWCMTQKTQVLFEYLLGRQIQRVQIRYGLVVHTTRFGGGEKINVLTRYAKGQIL